MMILREFFQKLDVSGKLGQTNEYEETCIIYVYMYLFARTCVFSHMCKYICVRCAKNSPTFVRSGENKLKVQKWAISPLR